MRSFLRKDQLLSPPDLQRVVDLYDGEILWTDHQIGLLFDHLKKLGIWDDSLLVVMADHGEEFQEHRSLGHTRTLYEEVLRVPLIIKPPGGRPRGWRPVVTERVRNIDVASTLLHLAGLEIPATFEGESLAGLMEKPGRDRPVFARTLQYGRGKIALIESQYKLIQTFAPRRELYELYDLGADPAERTSLFKTDRKRARRMRRKATALLGQMHRSRPTAASSNPSVELTDNQLRHLRALGYVQ